MKISASSPSELKKKVKAFCFLADSKKVQIVTSGDFETPDGVGLWLFGVRGKVVDIGRQYIKIESQGKHVKVLLKSKHDFWIDCEG